MSNVALDSDKIMKLVGLLGRTAALLALLALCLTGASRHQLFQA